MRELRSLPSPGFPCLHGLRTANAIVYRQAWADRCLVIGPQGKVEGSLALGPSGVVPLRALVFSTRKGVAPCTFGALSSFQFLFAFYSHPTCAMVELPSRGVFYQLATTHASTSRWVTL